MKLFSTINFHLLQQQFQRTIDAIFYFFPVNLTLVSLKRNLWLLLLWLLLFGIASGNIGGSLGVPYLFLDPEYNHEVNFWGFLFLGIALGGFMMAYHITCYILYAYRYNFLGMVRYPFFNFAVNNSLIPLAFTVYYLYRISFLQANYEQASALNIAGKLLGLLLGIFLMVFLIMMYFRFTNKNVFKMMAVNLDKTLRKNKMQRQNIMDRMNIARKHTLNVDTYFVLPYHIYPTPMSHAYDREALLKVFDQNQLNAMLLQAVVVISILLLGIVREVPWLQLPAAASILLLFTMVLMFAGAIAYWLRGWASTVLIIAISVFLLLAQKNTQDPYHKAFGLSYDHKVEYSTDRMHELSSRENFLADKAHTLEILKNWRAKFPPHQKPRMVFLSMSGGGQRAAIWTMKTLQVLDSLSDGKIMDNTMLISGSSGGLIGACYFRDLYWQQKKDTTMQLHSQVYLEKLGKDKLNPMVFSLVVSDLFFRFQTFELNGESYYKDRGYSLEKKILADLDSALGKPIGAYYEPEYRSEIPMVIVGPTIVNDGRKLFISPQPISYLNSGNVFNTEEVAMKARGIEFRRFFAGLSPDSLQFMSALRMNATFPYITPNVMLPSEPTIEILDAGLSDNFGLSDVIRFLFVFREWIAAETSGVVMISIRDTPKEMDVKDYEKGTSIARTFSPLSILWENLQNQQDIRNDASIEYARGWFNGNLDYQTIEYTGTDNKAPDNKKASLSWRLTSLEKSEVINEIYSEANTKALNRIVALINADTATTAAAVPKQ